MTGGTHSSNGILEININGTWGTVCDDGFTDVAATIACTSLGLASPGTFIPSGAFTPSAEAQIWLDDISCTGSETSIDLCSHLPFGQHNCGHGEDVGIQCGNCKFWCLHFYICISIFIHLNLTIHLVPSTTPPAPVTTTSPPAPTTTTSTSTTTTTATASTTTSMETTTNPATATQMSNTTMANYGMINGTNGITIGTTTVPVENTYSGEVEAKFSLAGPLSLGGGLTISSENWPSEIENTSSPLFLQAAEAVKGPLILMYLEAGYEDVNITVNGFKKGSIITDYIVALRSLTSLSQSEIMTKVATAVASLKTKPSTGGSGFSFTDVTDTSVTTVTVTSVPIAKVDSAPSPSGSNANSPSGPVGGERTSNSTPLFANLLFILFGSFTFVIVF